MVRWAHSCGGERESASSHLGRSKSGEERGLVIQSVTPAHERGHPRSQTNPEVSLLVLHLVQATVKGATITFSAQAACSSVLSVSPLAFLLEALEPS